MKSVKPGNELLTKQANFGRYFAEHDKRRGTDFNKTFPELAEFFEFCKSIKI